jgi:hypothetical protein
MNNKGPLTSLIDFIKKNTAVEVTVVVVVVVVVVVAVVLVFVCRDTQYSILTLLSYGNDCHIHIDIEVHKEHFQ